MTNTVQSIWGKVERRGPHECWPWVGRSQSSFGYGRIDVQNVEGVYAHRVAYLAANPGSISLRSAGLHDQVLHSCDNPRCCNPAHLFLGTHGDNMRDKAAKGRCPDLRGAKGPRAKLTEQQVREARHLLSLNLSSSEIALAFGVSKPTVKSLRIGRHYSEVA